MFKTNYIDSKNKKVTFWCASCHYQTGKVKTDKDDAPIIKNDTYEITDGINFSDVKIQYDKAGKIIGYSIICPQCNSITSIPAILDKQTKEENRLSVRIREFKKLGLKALPVKVGEK